MTQTSWVHSYVNNVVLCRMQERLKVLGALRKVGDIVEAFFAVSWWLERSVWPPYGEDDGLAAVYYVIRSFSLYRKNTSC